MEPEFKVIDRFYDAMDDEDGSWAVPNTLAHDASWHDVKAAAQEYARRTGRPVRLIREEVITISKGGP